MIEIYMVFAFVFLTTSLILLPHKSILSNCVAIAFALLGLGLFMASTNSYLVACSINATCNEASFIATKGLSPALVWAFIGVALLNLLSVIVKAFVVKEVRE
ncbi:MAG: hypothetical protein QW104_03445 [Nitrososphaerota archaeon]